ncbi:uncharacterized protein PG998_007019 [Apiospora kogelbergensis]|uniref:uncharacterized protein n=1 Tax=Apiospora kogelbergensis TaxID=1337665 RepID=UPI00313287C9
MRSPPRSIVAAVFRLLQYCRMEIHLSLVFWSLALVFWSISICFPLSTSLPKHRMLLLFGDLDAVPGPYSVLFSASTPFFGQAYGCETYNPRYSEGEVQEDEESTKIAESKTRRSLLACSGSSSRALIFCYAV